jgi:hypothetical protein
MARRKSDPEHSEADSTMLEVKVVTLRLMLDDAKL